MTTPCACPPAQDFVESDPATFDALWRSGAVGALLTTTCKIAARSADGGTTLRMTQLLTQLLRPAAWQAVQQPAPGARQAARQAAAHREPWLAGSIERQQFALLAAARVGGPAAEFILNFHLTPQTPGITDAAELQLITDMLNAEHALVSPALQLAQPPLRELVAVAAPAVLARADRLGAGPPPDMSRAAAFERMRPPFDVLAALAQELDPLALGLELPGCYNPACASLEGEGEASMPLKRCMGCRIAT
jgi:hypothetical protein